MHAAAGEARGHVVDQKPEIGAWWFRPRNVILTRPPTLALVKFAKVWLPIRRTLAEFRPSVTASVPLVLDGFAEV
jgi:hypothetical protein